MKCSSEKQAHRADGSNRRYKPDEWVARGQYRMCEQNRLTDRPTDGRTDSDSGSNSSKFPKFKLNRRSMITFHLTLAESAGCRREKKTGVGHDLLKDKAA
ncbi:hypothetical protein CBL_10587 [Carabus blaptoides fortunei]